MLHSLTYSHSVLSLIQWHIGVGPLKADCVLDYRFKMSSHG